MRSSTMCNAIVLVCMLSFASVPEAGAVQGQLSAVSRVKNFIKTASGDKMPILRKGAVGALVGALIIAGGMFPTAGEAYDGLPHNDAMVVVSRDANKALVMPVREYLGERRVIVNPAIVRDLAEIIANFVNSSSFSSYYEEDPYDDGKLVRRIWRYWEESLGVQGDGLEDAGRFVYYAKRDGKLGSRSNWTGNHVPSGKEVERLKQQLAFLPLEELTASLNAALLDEDATGVIFPIKLSPYAVLTILYAYGNSGYLDVHVDSEGRAKPNSDAELANFPPTNGLYGHSFGNGFVHTRMGEVDPPRVEVRPRRHYPDEYFYNMIMRRAADNGHLGIINALLAYNYGTDFGEALEIASGRGHTEIVKAILTVAKVKLNVALQPAAYGGHIEIAKALIEAGADDLNSALDAAASGRKVEMVKLLVDKGATDFTSALRTAVYWAGYASASDIIDFLVSLDGVDFNAVLKTAAVNHNLEEVKRFIGLGANDFDGALQEMAAYRPGGTKVAELLITRATDFNAALLKVLGSENVWTGGLSGGGEEDLVRMLIRAGADDVVGALEATHESEAEILLEIFAEERPQQNPAQLPFKQQ